MKVKKTKTKEKMAERMAESHSPNKHEELFNCQVFYSSSYFPFLVIIFWQTLFVTKFNSNIRLLQEPAIVLITSSL